MKFVKSNHCATLINEHLGELIRTSNNALSRFLGIRKSNKNLILTITIHHFYVKLAFFTVFVLTLQTGFAARRCFWFSANYFHWTSLPAPEARTVTWGAGGETHPLEIFSSPLEKRVGQNLKLLDIVQIFLAPLRDFISPLGVPSSLRGWKKPVWKRSIAAKKAHFWNQCSL